MLSKAALKRMTKLLKWSKLIAKFAAICTTLTGAATVASSSSTATTGVALGAAGATGYAAAKNIPSDGYERTKHIPPKAMADIDKAARIEAAFQKKREEMKTRKDQLAGNSKPMQKVFDRDMKHTVTVEAEDEPMTNPKTNKVHPVNAQSQKISGVSVPAPSPKAPQFFNRKSIIIASD